MKRNEIAIHIKGVDLHGGRVIPLCITTTGGDRRRKGTVKGGGERMPLRAVPRPQWIVPPTHSRRMGGSNTTQETIIFTLTRQYRRTHTAPSPPPPLRRLYLHQKSRRSVPLCPVIRMAALQQSLPTVATTQHQTDTSPHPILADAPRSNTRQVQVTMLAVDHMPVYQPEDLQDGRQGSTDWGYYYYVVVERVLFLFIYWDQDVYEYDRGHCLYHLSNNN
jgi:hypothetical protein